MIDLTGSETSVGEVGHVVARLTWACTLVDRLAPATSNSAAGLDGCSCFATRASWVRIRRDGALHKVLSLAALENPGWLERAMLLIKELRGCSIGKRL
jgi:hypothetical protein